MTLQEAKDQVAKKHGFDNFQECYVMGLETSTKELCKYLEEAAELYAKSKWDECYETTKANTFAIGLKGIVPKEKAKELVEKYDMFLYKTNWEQSKRCALIAWQEVIDSKPIAYSLQYCEEVKQEIEKL